MALQFLSTLFHRFLEHIDVLGDDLMGVLERGKNGLAFLPVSFVFPSQVLLRHFQGQYIIAALGLFAQTHRTK